MSTGDLYSATTQGQIILQDTNPQIQISGLTLNTTQKFTGVNSSTQLYSFTESLSDGAIIDYIVYRTDSTGVRTGQIIAAWSSSSTQAAQTSSRDVGAATTGLELSVTADGSKVYINSVHTSGTFNVVFYIKMLKA